MAKFLTDPNTYTRIEDVPVQLQHNIAFGHSTGVPIDTLAVIYDMPINWIKGTSKNSRYRSRATRLSSNDSGLFSFRFVDVHSRTVRDWQRNQFFEVPSNYLLAHPFPNRPIDCRSGTQGAPLRCLCR
jgi:hypothetical protein